MVRADYTFIVDTDRDRFTYGRKYVEISVFHENPSIFRGQSAPLPSTRIQYRRFAWGIIIKRDT